jgi:type 1 glutamine amidotransferase
MRRTAVAAVVLSALAAIAACLDSTAVNPVAVNPPPDAAGDVVELDAGPGVDLDADAALICPPALDLTVPVRPLRILFLTTEHHYIHPAAHDAGDVTMPAALRARGHYVVVANDIAPYYTDEVLSTFDVIYYFITSGLVVTQPAQRDALVKFVHAGKGIVGAHTATETDTDWPFTRDLFGAIFYGHGAGAAQITEASVNVVDASPMTSFLPSPWVRTDEWYFFIVNPATNPLVHQLIQLDESTIEQWRTPSDGSFYPDVGYYGDAGHPLVWTMRYECARVFYSSFGHTGEAWTDDLNLRMMTTGVEWAGAPSSVRFP